MNGLITSTTWLEPLLPSAFSAELLDKADAVRFMAGQLSNALPSETASIVADLLLITNSYYSNLIEGQYTEPLALAQQSPRRSPKELTALAVTHMQVQGSLERALRLYHIPWDKTFGAKFLEIVHRALFRNASPADLTLADGSLFKPGQLRDAAAKNVSVGQHDAPDFTAVTPMIQRMEQVYTRVPDGRGRLLATLAYHHRLAWVHPFPDGNGRVVRLVTHLQLGALGLASPLWSLSRGLARQQELYYARLSNADAPRRHDLDGRGQLTEAGLLEFIGFMLDTCLDQMGYMLKALRLTPLRERLERLVVLEPRFVDAGIRPEAARALGILLSQGKTTRNDFKIYLGLGERMAIDQLQRLIKLGLVVSPTPKSREVYAALPAWLAEMLLPDLHRRFGMSM